VEDAVDVVLVSGTLGVGKTAVSDEMSLQLQGAGVPHGLIDVDALDQCLPHPADDPWGERLACANLAAVAANFRRHGARRLVLARAVQGRQQLAGYRDAIPGARITVVRLEGSPETIRRRLQDREVGSLREWFVSRTDGLGADLENAAVEDFVVSNDGRSVPEVASEILDRLGWVSRSS
jgi:adenylylsulfate kinase